jgi:PPM family protein phosphatase
VTTAIKACGLSDVGKKRKHNEDAFSSDVSERLFIVADGMGGHAAGEVASKITVETIGEFIAATRQKEEATWPFKYNHELDFNSNRLAVAIEKANERVMAAVAAQPWLKGMGTTVVAGLLNERILSLAHVGDSRAYLLRNGALTQLSQDQTLVAKLVREGVLTEEEAARSEHQNVILQAIGTTPEVEPEIWREGLALAPGDTLILCSDGLHGLVSDAVIAATASGRDPMDACRALIAHALEAGGSENVSVGVFRVEAVEQKAQPADGATRRIRVPQGALQDDGGGGSMQTRRIAVAKGPA